MVVYRMGKVIQKTDIRPTPTIVTKAKCLKNGYFSRCRTGWTEMDVTIVVCLLKGETIKSIADLLGMKQSYFYKVLLTLRSVKRVNSNRELMALAIQEGVINLSINTSVVLGQEADELSTHQPISLSQP